jgi:hypothetical protein
MLAATSGSFLSSPWYTDGSRWSALKARGGLSISVGSVNAVMNIRVPLNAGNFLTSRELVSFSGRTLLHGVRK